MRLTPRLLGPVLLAALVLPVGPAAPTASAASVDGVTLTGHGYGHGIGMSQYGAYGAAREGLSYGRIVSFYYPGTKPGRTDGRIRVQVSADSGGDVVVEPRQGLRVRDLATGRTRELPSGNGARLWRLKRNADGDTLVGFRDARQWRFLTRLKGLGELDAKGAVLALHTPSGVRRYRGSLRLAAGDTVNVLGIDNYLKGVVPGEMPSSWHPQALRAQAVAARSYAAWERRNPRAGHFDVFDTVASQVYGGYGAEAASTNAAVDDTAGEIRTSGGGPAFTQFSSSNGGFAAPGSQPYLKAHRDPYDGWSGNPNHDWSVRVPASTIEARWPGVGDLRGVRVTKRDGHGEWGGRAVTVAITGSGGTTTVSGPDFRFALGLRSHWFRVG
ncbi:SpoIID/LytB domain-containing protein [uncultured Nocardioides sp.]|uniref:SpoIID/LytB domain-containing protein n=1 Tax=uncultured Nocardioides sp. TaxID=198441 RepID=UPI0026302E7B|nr:SpoIID/LytB domain-containing protein [uncultured Nocardioides sp.]